MSALPQDADAPHDINDNAHWIKPPESENGEPIRVDIRINLRRVSDVDTVAGTDFVKIEVMCCWTDQCWSAGRTLAGIQWTCLQSFGDR